MNLQTWAMRWGHLLPPEAQNEFNQIMFPHNFVGPEPSELSESAVQANIRLAHSQEFGGALYRNNSGAAMMINPKRPDDPPRHVRFGLGNDSKRINDKWKSSDLIGITPIEITTAHIGKRLGVFTAVEVKQPGWTLKPSDKRAHGQATFMNAVAMLGGLSGFAQSTDDLRRIIRNGRPRGA